jgi:hypothetical protein
MWTPPAANGYGLAGGVLLAECMAALDTTRAVWLRCGGERGPRRTLCQDPPGGADWSPRHAGGQEIAVTYEIPAHGGTRVRALLHGYD